MIKVGLAILLGAVAAPGAAATLAEAHEAYGLNKIGDATRIFATIASDAGASGADRAEANVELARIAWLIDGDAGAALKRLDTARATGREACDVEHMRMRVLREAGRNAEAVAAETGSLAACAEPEPRDAIRIHAIEARLAGALDAPSERQRLLQQAKADEAALTNPASGAGARIRLETALLERDAPGALAAWKDYFWLTETDAPPALTQFHPAALFTKGLGSNASTDDRVELAHLLMRAGFAQALERFVAGLTVPATPPNEHLKLVQAYLAERDQLMRTTLEVNRALARGGSRDDQRLQQAAMKALGGLMGAAGATGDPRAAVLEHYGLIGSVGQTSGYPSLHLGHVVDDRTETVRQYGHEAKIRFAVIDNMWANGFESWLWDGSAETGGWSGDDSIIQVRSAYTSGPASAYTLVGDSAARRKIAERMAAWDAEDAAKARSRVPATLRGVNARLRLQVVDQVAAAAKRKGGDFHSAFLSEYWRGNTQQSIFVHEGRHAIDKAMAADPSKLDDTRLEYQANLSELALSDYPRMALWNLNRSIGGSSPHEAASTRLMGEIASWVQKHAAEVAGYDPSLPPAVQIDKLTDAQLRMIARSLDPLAKGFVATASGDSPSGTSRR
jgi:hypothetical protein